MLGYVRSIWKCRYFWLSLVRIDLRTRYRRSWLGLGWSLLQPLTMTAVFCLIVRPLLMPGKPLIHCALFFLTGLVCWHFIVNVTVQGCLSLIRGEVYIRQHPAPMAIYPLRTTLGFAVQLGLVMSLIVLLSCCWHGSASWIILTSVLPALLLLVVLGWSLAVLAGFANVWYQDVQHMCEVGFQVLFYGTPILYGPELLRPKNLEWVFYLNPLTPLIGLVREPLLYGRLANPMLWLMAVVIVAFFFSAACLMLATQQRRIIFHM